MIILGITGGIGTGKSTLTEIFRSLNYPAFNSDLEAKRILNQEALQPELIKLFGEEVIKNTQVDRKLIASQVFSDASKLEELNALIHPKVGEAFEKFKAKHANSPLIIKEAAILFETGIYKQNDYNLLVTAPEDLRIQRVIQRDEISEAEVQQRMRNQWPDEKKIPLADFIIDNSGEHFLIPQVLSIHKELKNKLSYA